MTLAPVRIELREAADSMAKASDPEPFSKSKTSNWVARGGGLPAYIQHIAHDIAEKRGKSVSNAIQIAIGVVKRWARGGGNVDSGTQAAASKAVAEWEKLKAGAHAKPSQAALEPSLTDFVALQEAAVERILLLSETLGGQDGLVNLLAEGVLMEAAQFAPTFKRVASAPGELERHEMYDGGQHVATLSRRKSFGAEPDRHSAFAVNGQELTDFAEKSRQGAIDAVKRHLEEAPARIMPHPAGRGKHLVAKPGRYGGKTTYEEYPNEPSARHAAGLPSAPSSVEVSSKVANMAEGLRFDLMTVSGLDIRPLAGVQEARRRDPFDLTEAFNPGERRGFHGRWVGPGRAAAEALKRGEGATIAPEHAHQLIDQLNDGSVSSLHMLNVSGHPNLFRAHARDLPRSAMPQIPPDHLPGFMDFLSDKRVLASVEKVKPSKLKATQKELDGGKAAKMASGGLQPTMTMVSKDGHILDGHHRWGAHALHELSNPGHTIDTLRFSAGTDRMLQLMHEYNAQHGIKSQGFGAPRAVAA